MIEQNKKDLKFRVIKDGVLMFLTPQVDMARQMERHLNYLEEQKNRVMEAPVVVAEPVETPIVETSIVKQEATVEIRKPVNEKVVEEKSPTLGEFMKLASQS